MSSTKEMSDKWESQLSRLDDRIGEMKAKVQTLKKRP